MIVYWTVIHFSYLVFFAEYVKNCEIPSTTSASGDLIVKEKQICSGDLIFEDNFDFLDLVKWQQENTEYLTGNWEFQYYTKNICNLFTKDGALHIRPTLTSESLLNNACLTSSNIQSPVRSSILRTPRTFAFKFGKLQARAKMPAGDWLWPAIWLLPKNDAYGLWPTSGEIDLVVSRGNRNLMQNGVNIGCESITSSLHFGPYPLADGYKTAKFNFNSPAAEGFDKDFHLYELEWTPDTFTFKVDDKVIGIIEAGEGFWVRGNFEEISGANNPWVKGSPLAPFDQEFYIIVSLAVGGITHFPDDAENPGGKPWKNSCPSAINDFWKNRDQWIPTWHLDDKNNIDSSLLVDYIRVYAL